LELQNKHKIKEKMNIREDGVIDDESFYEKNTLYRNSVKQSERDILQIREIKLGERKSQSKEVSKNITRNEF
jgi:hypothetical protein